MSAVPVSTRLLTDEAYRRIDRELAKYPATQRQSATMSALAIAQDEKGHITPEIIDDLAAYLRLPPIAIYEVATFYNMYNMKPTGKYKLAVCTCLPCGLRDGDKAGEYLKEKLGIDYNETTADGMFTLKESECQGACGDAPVMLVNNKQMCSFMDNQRLDELIAKLRAQG